ncbi:uncharacterized protein LOC117123027 isoform X2 [Anneissia japonica]|uniref:uncharacterized protein LOC117123027 isoform X2 n=1 Tax=Anneissia japonica TaxID=1529436 RepID=UPI0014256919|nr:uncharacterized protein LOC117123027 isoform X2 [Anneissia japonica]
MVLAGALYTGRTDLTITDCIESCRNAGYTYSGTINGEQCSCGNTIEESPGDVTLVSESYCNVACSGDSTEVCGGNGYTSIYVSSIGQDGGTYTLPEGYIYSPNFPSAYTGETVTWMISFENPTLITVTIRMFSLAMNDQLVLTSGANAVSETISGGESLTLPYVWKPNLTASFEIQLLSATTDPRNGFVISYEAITGSCGGDFTGTSGYIASPGYPGNAPSSSSCMYTITAPEDYVIVITIEQRLLPSGTSLSIADDGVISSVTNTGAIDPSATNVISVVFMSGTISSPSTFLISYTASPRTCDALPTVPFGTLNSSVSGTLYPPQTVSFVCNNGYSSPNNSVTCTDDGSWTSAECIVICDAVPTIQFGSVDAGGSTEFNPGDTVTLTCNNGYTPSSSMITCFNDGSWSVEQCIEIPTTTMPTATVTAVVTTKANTESTTTETVGKTSTMATAVQSTPKVVTEPKSTEAVTTVDSTTPESTTESTPDRASDLCRVSSDPTMESLPNQETPNVLSLNVGNPLDCDGYLTGIKIFSSDTSTVTINVLRFLATNRYQLIGRFDVVGETSQVVAHSLDETDWIQFESGDMIGTSSTLNSPLTFSDDQADSVDYMIWDLMSDPEFHTSEVGDEINLMSTTNRPKRTYSWAVSIEANTTCPLPTINNAKITPSSDVYKYGEQVMVQCDDGYTPTESGTLTCRIDGNFDSFTCKEKDRKTFFLIIGLVIASVLFVLIMIVIIMVACIEEDEPIRPKPKRSNYPSTGSGRSDNSQRFLIPIDDDGVRGKGIPYTNPTPVVDERPSQLIDPQYPPVDYPLDDEREAIQAIDEAVLGFEGDSLSFESGPMDTRSGGDSARHHVTFSDRR